jgi:hypothetical protein
MDNIETLMAHELGRQHGYLLPEQEPQLHLAITLAFDLA